MEAAFLRLPFSRSTREASWAGNLYTFFRAVKMGRFAYK